MSTANVNVSLAKVARLLREANEELQAANDAADINHRVQLDAAWQAFLKAGETVEQANQGARVADDCFCPSCGRRGFRFVCPTCREE